MNAVPSRSSPVEATKPPRPVAAFLLVLTFGAVFAATIRPAAGAPTHLVDQRPVSITTTSDGTVLVDFGRVAFGNLRLVPAPGASGTITVHFGEAFSGGRINRKPPGSVRYARTELKLSGSTPVVAAPAPDARNTRQVAPNEKPDQFGHITPSAVLTPPAWGVVLPFRWVEIEGWPGELASGQIIRQAAFAATWDDDAAAFRCSDDRLNRIWELCRYSIKATTFAGVYVDGERERIPYEADAYLNQISHYYTDRDLRMARDTYDHLMANSTWPTEWASHLVFMLHADWMHTGDAAWVASRYPALKSKLLIERARADGLITSTPAQIKKGDLVDWPPAERDGFVFTPVNTVANAFYLRGLVLMTELARVAGQEADASAFAARERTARAAFQEKLFDATRGVYRDGEGTAHASQHASLFPLAFDLVPPAERDRVTAFVVSRRMACSVYAAQYLLEALFQNGAAGVAFELITAAGDRSWRHMLESGTTITWEAWDQKYKPNQDWNHAWGAAPANLFPRYILGVQAHAPGWSRAVVRPFPGPLRQAEGKVPTPRGPVLVSWVADASFRLSLQLPAGVPARLDLPAAPNSKGVFVDGRSVPARRIGDRWLVDEDVVGTRTIEVRP